MYYLGIALPFIFFWLGYYSVFYVVPPTIHLVPDLRGIHLTQAVRLLCAENLHLGFLGEKEELNLPESTILKQVPSPGARLKQDQSVYVLISKKPSPLTAPELRGKTIDQLTRLPLSGIKTALYFLPNPTGKQEECFTQYPSPEEPLPFYKPYIIAYITSPATKPIIWPSFKNISVTDVCDFLASHTKHIDISHKHPIEKDHVCEQCYVVDQQPRGGTFIPADTLAQLKVSLLVVSN